MGGAFITGTATGAKPSSMQLEAERSADRSGDAPVAATASGTSFPSNCIVTAKTDVVLSEPLAGAKTGAYEPEA